MEILLYGLLIILGTSFVGLIAKMVYGYLELRGKSEAQKQMEFFQYMSALSIPEQDAVDTFNSIPFGKLGKANRKLKRLARQHASTTLRLKDRRDRLRTLV